MWLDIGMIECPIPWVTITLTFDLVLEPVSSLVHISHVLRGRYSKFGVKILFGMVECPVLFLGHCDLDL